MRLLKRAPLDTCLDSPLLCQPLNSRFALHGLRAFDLIKFCFKLPASYHHPSDFLFALCSRFRPGVVHPCHCMPTTANVDACSLGMLCACSCILKGCNFLFTIGSFRLTVELLAYSCAVKLLCLQLKHLYLQLKLFTYN